MTPKAKFEARTKINSKMQLNNKRNTQGMGGEEGEKLIKNYAIFYLA